MRALRVENDTLAGLVSKLERKPFKTNVQHILRKQEIQIKTLPLFKDFLFESTVKFFADFLLFSNLLDGLEEQVQINRNWV